MALEAKILLNIPWIKVKDWSALTASDKGSGDGQSYVTNKDIDKFVNHIIRKMSKELKIQYGELKRVIFAQNRGFYIEKKRLFIVKKSYAKEEKKLLRLEERLTIPDTISQSSKCYLAFASFSTEEKEKFLELVKNTKL